MKITKADTAGWRIEVDDKIFYIGEYGRFGCYQNDGVVYKDSKAFKTGIGVCYVNEYGFENATDNGTKLFEFEAKQTEATDILNNSYITQEGYTRQDLIDLCGTVELAEDLFEHLDWMSPETLLSEWDDDDDENGVGLYDVEFDVETLPIITVRASSLKEAKEKAELDLDNMSKNDIISRFVDAIEYTGCVIKNIKEIK